MSRGMNTDARTGPAGPEADTEWRHISALQSLARCSDLALLREPLAALMAALDLGGYKFCIAAPQDGAFRIVAVIAGGNLDVATDRFLHRRIGPTDPILWESYRSVTPISWTPSFFSRHRMEASGIGALVDNGVTAGASIPIFSRHSKCRASLCVSGAPGEAPTALDLRLPAFWPSLRLAGLALFESGVAEACRSATKRFTPCEVEILEALAAGRTIKDTAEKLGKAERTIRNQLDSARAKVGASTTIEAVVKWQNGAMFLH